MKTRSKKRSSTPKQPKYKYFVDRDLGSGFCQILRSSGIDVIDHDEIFGERTTDEEWLREVGTKGWVAITHDRSIRYNPVAKKALLLARVRTFVVIGHAPANELADNFVNTIAEVESLLDKKTGPFIAKVYRPTKGKLHSKGKVKIWLE